MVLPIMLYDSEVWDVYNFKSIDKLHLRFCKYILGVKNQTPNNAVPWELGRFPLSVLCRERSPKCWCKIMSKTDSPIYCMYKDLCDNVRNNCWTSRIKTIIDHLEYSQLTLMPTQTLFTIWNRHYEISSYNNGILTWIRYLN